MDDFLVTFAIVLVSNSFWGWCGYRAGKKRRPVTEAVTAYADNLAEDNIKMALILDTIVGYQNSEPGYTIQDFWAALAKARAVVRPTPGDLYKVDASRAVSLVNGASPPNVEAPFLKVEKNLAVGL